MLFDNSLFVISLLFGFIGCPLRVLNVGVLPQDQFWPFLPRGIPAFLPFKLMFAVYLLHCDCLLDCVGVQALSLPAADHDLVAASEGLALLCQVILTARFITADCVVLEGLQQHSMELNKVMKYTLRNIYVDGLLLVEVELQYLREGQQDVTLTDLLSASGNLTADWADGLLGALFLIRFGVTIEVAYGSLELLDRVLGPKMQVLGARGERQLQVRSVVDEEEQLLRRYQGRMLRHTIEM